MAEWRRIHTKFWTDPSVFDFTPEDRLFYLCLLTNPKTTACGVYEIHVKELVLYTGFNAETIKLLLERFESYGRIAYNKEESEILLRNFLRYNPPQNPSVLTLISRELEQVKTDAFRVYVLKTLKEKESSKEKETDKDLDRDRDRVNDTVLTPSPHSVHTVSPSPDEDVRLVVDELNRLTSRSFKLHGRKEGRLSAQARFISARLQDGYSVEECMIVVRDRVGRWLNDEKMREYLRPSTLFNSEKFESYLQEAKSPKAISKNAQILRDYINEGDLNNGRSENANAPCRSQ